MKASISLAAALRTKIVRGELALGEPLPNEDELMSRFGLSRGVVREALRILEAEGLVTIRRGLGGGARVRHPSLMDTAMAMGVYLQLGDIRVSDIWASRDRLVANAVEMLATDATEEAAIDLAEAATALQDSVGDFDGFYPRYIAVGDTAVRLAGSATDFMLVGALRHIISVELEQATRAIDDYEKAVRLEGDVANAWLDTAKHVKAHRTKAARAAYDRQHAIMSPIPDHLGTDRVIDMFQIGPTALGA